MIWTGRRRQTVYGMQGYGHAYLVGGNAAGERLLDTIARYCSDNEVWESRLERHEQVQDSNL